MSKTVLAALVGLVVVISGLVRQAHAQGLNPEFVQQVVELTNAQRRANGLPGVRASGILAQTAQYHAEDQSRRNYIGHDSPEGVTPRDRILRAGYDPNTFTSENIYNGGGSPTYTDPSAAVNWWMNSPGHRASILNPQFTEIGVGLAITEATGMHIYVQNFGSASTSAPGGWGAIAYSPSTGLYGASHGRGSAGDAEAAAVQMCTNGASDCTVAVSYRQGCGVVKRDPATGIWGSGQAGGNGMPAINAAGMQARGYCLQAGGQWCNELVAATCSR
jgi:uncharacterized protein YkwD